MKIMFEVMNLTMTAILSDALHLSYSFECSEVILYMKIMFEVMNLTMTAILSDALHLSYLFE